MLSPGVRSPRLNMRICLAVTLVAWAFVAWGAIEMLVSREETLGSGLKIGIALLPAIIGPFFVYNFWRSVKVFASIRRGENAIGRWTVTAAELAEFSALEGARNAQGGENRNEWTPPRDPPPAGIEVIFVPDGVLVGDTYFALVTVGVFKFTHVWMLPENPPAIAFRTVLTLANRFGVRATVGALRIPVSRAAAAEAARVVDHFQRVDTREVLVNRGFYRSRIKFGLIAAPICFAVALVGFVLKSNGKYSDATDVSGILIGIGLLLGLASLVLALAAWGLSRGQRRGRQPV